jgi:phosphomannomutase
MAASVGSAAGASEPVAPDRQWRRRIDGGRRGGAPAAAPRRIAANPPSAKTFPMQVKASAFKAYDIRGIVDDALDDDFAEHLGRAFGSEAVRLGEKAVAVGRDGRVSGPRLVAALVKGLRSTGLDVVDIGAVTTPMLYYVAATRGQHGCHSGIQVTGSHNPKNYNGFKMVLAGRAIYGEDIQKLR